MNGTALFASPRREAGEVVRILLIEDNPGDARLTRELLLESGGLDFAMTHVERLADGIARLAAEPFDIALLDLSLGDAQGLESVVRLHGSFPLLPLIVLSGLDDELTAVEALQNGAQDYLVKGQGDGHLTRRAIRYAIERKRVHLQLVEAKEKAELASRAKSEFLANMSHELRTPLNAIIGFSELMRTEALGPVGNAAYLGYARDIHESGVHLLSIINDILDLSKIEAGTVELREEHVEPAHLVQACVRIVKERAAAAEVTLVSTVADDLPLLLADERLLKQVILNLLSNATKFTPAGGRVTVRGAATADGGLALSIDDNGIGIDERDIERALTPFVQIDSSLSRKYSGTGLGLPLTRSLVELHGGALEIRSRVGEGTTVTVRFPPARVMPLPATAAAS
jgi:signal transduction histidine kinase